MNNPPQLSIWLDVPDDCRMQAAFTGDGDIHVAVGELSDGTNLLFEREALERFVRLAGELLAAALPADDLAELPVLVA